MGQGQEIYQRYIYEKAPLQEAIFEANFATDVVDDVTLPGLFFEKIAHDFPQKNNVNVIGTRPLNKEELKNIPVVQAWNEARTRCLQFGPEIIAANDTAYTGWENFVPMVNLLLKSYFECVNPLIAKKVGFRCINRFVIPHTNVIIPDYFRINLALSPTLQGSAGFNINLLKQATFNETKINAQVRFASDLLKPNESGFAFILDIDAFTLNELTNDPKTLLKKAADCHEFLKRIFEDLLQDKTRALLRIKNDKF